ncbi:MAG: hypothetical protein JW969_00140 [Spirochaetales bacterium]|nr:hypothetical protein [Spirochaetales bacterium]
MARVALTYNLIHENEIGDQPVDRIAELDSPQTVDAVRAAIESGGHTVLLIEADENAFRKFRDARWEIDIVFNIAEGLRGESRESHIPAMLEMLGIPYVGSGPLTLAACLDKEHTKKILAFHGIPYPAYQVFITGSETLDPELKFPLITKLACEGSSMGLTYDSVTENAKDTHEQVNGLMKKYGGPVIVEEFKSGREFGIPVIGNELPETLPVIEYKFHGEKPITIFVPDNELGFFKEKNYRILEYALRRTGCIPLYTPVSLKS